MNLTDEQQKVVAISAGRHLVLAPPGSGKTEMLSQRIVRAVESGIDPARMLCATFTNRAAFEMRARVEAHYQEAAMPEVGNLHHFCFRFLCSVKRLSPTRHILDECEQLSFVKERASRQGRAWRHRLALNQRRRDGCGRGNPRAAR